MGWNHDPDAIHSHQSGEINALTEKTTPADDDLLLLEDSADSNKKKKVKVSNLGGGAETLDDLTDVDTSGVSDGQVLKYDDGTSTWLPANDDTGSGSLPTPSTKGDIAVYDGSDWQVLAAGTNNHVLTADSAQSVGLKWAAGGGGGGPTVVRKSSTQSVTSSTTLENDDELLFAVGANDVWVVNAWLWVDGATGGDIKATFTGPSGSAGRLAVTGPGTSATTFENATSNNQAAGLGIAPPAGTFGSGNVTLVHVAATVVVGANSGNVQLQWAQQSSSGTATRVLDGSFLVAHKIS